MTKTIALTREWNCTAMLDSNPLASITTGKTDKPPRILIYGTEKIGKCLGKGTQILMFDGTIKAVENVKVGDSLMGPDSKPRTVLNLSLGTAPLFRVTYKSGEFVATGNHILSLKMGNTVAECVRRRGKTKGRTALVSVEEFVKKSPFFRNVAYGWRTGVEWSEKKSLPLPPYLFGAWLGDGSSSGPNITTMDKEVLDAMIEYVNFHSFGMKVNVVAQRGKAATYSITHGLGSGAISVPNAFRNALKELKVIDSKHIPHSYKTASRQDRLELLAGLIDTDGSIGAKKIHYEITQKNKQLAEDVVFLARSLGFSAHSSEVEKRCYNSKTQAVGKYQRIIIGGNVCDIPVRIKRKKASTKKKTKNVLTSSLKITAIGNGEFFGFEVDGDHLFLLGDFTVTHNSTWAANAPGAIFLPTEEGANEIDVPKFPIARTFSAVMQNIGALIENEHEYQSAIIDSADWLERLIHADVCAKDNSDSIELAAGGYGKGYGLALKLWFDVLQSLDYLRDNRGVQIIMIAHSQVERYEDPESPAYDRYSPKLHRKSSGPLVIEWCDAVLFATRKMRIVEEKQGYGKKRTTAAPIGASGGERILRCVGSPACVAGNRYNLPDELPLIYSAFAEAMEARS